MYVFNNTNMNSKRIYGLLGLFDLSGENIYVGVNDKLVREIEKDISSLFVGKEYFQGRFMQRLKRYKRISLRSLKRTSQFLCLDSEFVERNITMITSHRSTHVGIKNPRLPFCFRNREGMILIASIFGDGGISSEGNVRYHNQDKKLIDLFIKSLKVLGDVDFKVYFRKDKTYHVSLPIIVGHIFAEMGIPWGYKTKTNPRIPKYVFSLDRENKASFIRQFFNDEGNVRLKDRRLQLKQTRELKNVTEKEVKKNPEKYHPSCLKGMRNLLLGLNIISKISLSDFRDEGSIKTDWELSIYGKESLDSYSRLVGFDSESKRENLEKCLKSYKFPSAGRNERFLFALQYCAAIENKNNVFTKHDLSKMSKRSLKTATYFLVDMKKRGFVDIAERGRDKNGRLMPLRYRLTKNAWNYLREHKKRIFIEEIRTLL